MFSCNVLFSKLLGEKICRNACLVLSQAVHAGTQKYFYIRFHPVTYYSLILHFLIFGTSVLNFCHNDELSSTMSQLGCLLTDSGLFILFAENSQILLKISVIPILLTFMYLIAMNLLVNNTLNSLSNSTHHYSRN